MKEEQYTKAAERFKALSDPNRLKIVEILSAGEQCGCEILKELDLTQPTLSHHLKVLSSAGFVNARRDGKRMSYSLNLSVLLQVALLLFHALCMKMKKPVGKNREQRAGEGQDGEPNCFKNE